MHLKDLIILCEDKLMLAKSQLSYENLFQTYRHLGELYDILDDEVGSGARDKWESGESSKES